MPRRSIFKLLYFYRLTIQLDGWKVVGEIEAPLGGEGLVNK